MCIIQVSCILYQKLSVTQYSRYIRKELYRQTFWQKRDIYGNRVISTEKTINILGKKKRKKKTAQAISTSPAAEAAASPAGTSASPINASSSWSSSAAVLGFLGPLGARAMLVLVLALPPPPWEGRLRTGPPVKARLKENKNRVNENQKVGKREWTYGPDGALIIESSRLRRSTRGGFWILFKREAEVGALAERRGARGGIVSKSIDIGWPNKEERWF